MRAIITFCLFQILIATVSSLDEDVYWRDYRGTLPEDALIVDADSNQRRIAVGIVYVDDGGLYIGALYDGNQNIIVTGGPRPTFNFRNSRIKVLCTQSPDNYEWRAIESSQLGDVADLAIQGGFEGGDDNILYIGKATYIGEPRVGKVIGYKNYDTYGLLFFYDGAKEGNTKNYSLLIRKEYSVTQNLSNNITNVNNYNL